MLNQRLQRWGPAACHSQSSRQSSWVLKFENHFLECCNILQRGWGGGRWQFLKGGEAGEAGEAGKWAPSCSLHLPFLMDTFGPRTQSLSPGPIRGPLPGSFGLCWGTGSIMEESAGQDTAGSRQLWRTGEVGGCDQMSRPRGGLGIDVHLSQPCFLPHYHWQFWIAFSNKSTDRTQMFRMFQKKSLGEVALVYSQLFINAVFFPQKCKWCWKGERAASQQRTHTHLFMMKK